MDRFETFRLIWKKTAFAFQCGFSISGTYQPVDLSPSFFFSNLVVFEVQRITLTVEIHMCTFFMIEIQSFFETLFI